MRGILKHIWVSNTARLHDLAEAIDALRAAGIASMLMKGGALFARDPQLMAVRQTEDYDLLVHPKHIFHAVETLGHAGFYGLKMRIDLFSATDFDKEDHAIAISKSGPGSGIDLHWRPTPTQSDPHWRPAPTLHAPRFVDELFEKADTVNLLGHDLLIPSLTDQLFLAAIRPEPRDSKECFVRAIEIVHLLRSDRGQLHWQRFETFTGHHDAA